jgi:hypothetical protein
MKRIVFMSLIVSLLAIAALPLMVLAAPLYQVPTDVNGLVAQFAVLAGVAAFIAMLLNAFKSFGWLPDGIAAQVSVGLNLVGIVVLFLLDVFKPELVAKVDNIAGILAQIGVYLIALVIASGISKFTHYALRGFPVIGFSYTLKRG